MAEKPDFKIQIKATDMEEQLQKKTEEIALKAFDTCRQEKQLANYLKGEFDKAYGVGWNCVVGRNFGSHVVHQTKNEDSFRSYVRNCKAKSIFSEEGELDTIPTRLPHLQMNIRARGETLQDLKHKIYMEQNLLEDKSASYVSILMKEYKKKVTAIRLEKMQEELKVSSKQFNSVFGGQEDENDVREQKKNEKLRQMYFKNNILKPKEQESVKNMLRRSTNYKEPEGMRKNYDSHVVHISDTILSKPAQDEDKELYEQEVLRINQLQKQYEMYKVLLGDLFAENEKLIDRNADRFVCKNERILNMLEPMVVGSISLHADDICEMLIDDLLSEQVNYLNRLEMYKQYSSDMVNQTEKNHEELVGEIKKKPLPHHVMKIIKALDDYADDKDRQFTRLLYTFCGK